MSDLILNTPEQIKKRMYFWFLKNNQAIDEFNGSEQFTLFDKKPSAEKDQYLGMIDLQSEELPVFILTISSNEVIINTTKKFVRVIDATSEQINYSDFDWHTGFKNIIAGKDKYGKPMSIKTDGYVSEFGLRLKNGRIVYWNVPTGHAGFSFWNVTKKCELIGRKYS